MSDRTLSRRSFLVVVGGAGSAFALGCYSPVTAKDHTEVPEAAAFEPNAFVGVNADGTISITVSRSDMGQGVRTSLAMAVAEELDADWSKVKVVNAEGDSKKFGGQGTGGSSTSRTMHQRMRQMGAGARSMLVAAAADTWSVKPEECKTEKARVLHPDGKTALAYAELASKAAKMPVPVNGDIKLKDPSQFKIIGKPTLRVDNVPVAKGEAIYGIDVRRPGMVYATLLRPPTLGGSVESVDAADAKKVAGVLDVFQVSGGVAITATNTWSAIKARESLKVKWNDGPNTKVSSASIREDLKKSLGSHPETPAGAKTVNATFELPYLAHATMEPMNAVADVTADKCEIWCGSQSPDGAQNQAAQALGLPPEKVTVHLTLLGGGFGRRFNNDFVMQAVAISKMVKKPVKLLWTKEDDIQNDCYRPICHHVMRGAVKGTEPVLFSHLMAEAGMRPSAPQKRRMEFPYELPGASMTYSSVAAPVPTWFWRSVEHSQINVVNECFLDEVAHAAGEDPAAFRKKLIKDERLRKVLDIVLEKSGWGKPLEKGKGRGLACTHAYGSYAAHVAEVTVTGDVIRVDRVVAAVDPGLVINPKGVEAQMQGAIGDGVATALHAAITVKDGAIEQSNWHDYEWLRFDSAPKVEVYIAGGGDSPGGMGEVGYPGVPSAVANAVFAATGRRVRKFPIKVSELE